MNEEWDPYTYSYRIHWSPEAHGYVALVAEFPAMQSPPKITPQAALDALVTAVVEKLNQLDAKGEPRPAALALTGMHR
jgi:hypothetical protein